MAAIASTLPPPPQPPQQQQMVGEKLPSLNISKSAKSCLESFYQTQIKAQHRPLYFSPSSAERPPTACPGSPLPDPRHRPPTTCTTWISWGTSYSKSTGLQTTWTTWWAQRWISGRGRGIPKTGIPARPGTRRRISPTRAWAHNCDSSRRRWRIWGIWEKRFWSGLWNWNVSWGAPWIWTWRRFWPRLWFWRRFWWIWTWWIWSWWWLP